MFKEKPELEMASIGEIARAILEERPPFVLISDNHINSEAQDLAASLLELLSQSPQYHYGDVGFYVEALYDYADPMNGNLSGGVIEWDAHHRDAQNKTDGTNYAGAIQKVIDHGVPVHGIDLDKKVNDEGEERMSHWKRQIDKGKEPIKILLIGAGHIWNDPKKTPDLMYRLEGEQWLIQNEQAFTPAGHAQIITIDISQFVPSGRKYKIVKYKK